MKINLAILAVCVLFLVGCAEKSEKQYVEMTPPAQKQQPGEVVRKQQTKIEETQARVFELGQLITGLTAQNAPQVREQGLTLLGGVGYTGTGEFKGGIYRDFSDLVVNQKAVDQSVTQIVDHTRRVEAENYELKQDDPARKRLDSAGFWTFLAAIVAIVASFALASYLPLWVLRLRLIGAVLLIFSGAFYAMAWYLSEIRFIFICFIGAAGLAGLVVAVVYAIRNSNLLKKNIQKMELGVMTGQVVLTPDAKDEQKSVLKGVESPVLAAIVDKVQATVRKKVKKERLL